MVEKGRIYLWNSVNCMGPIRSISAQKSTGSAHNHCFLIYQLGIPVWQLSQVIQQQYSVLSENSFDSVPPWEGILNLAKKTHSQQRIQHRDIRNSLTQCCHRLSDRLKRERIKNIKNLISLNLWFILAVLACRPHITSLAFPPSYTYKSLVHM